MKVKNIIETAQKIMQEIGEKKLEDKTKNEYMKIFKQITKDKDGFLYEGSKSYYYKKKAALRYCIKQYMVLYLRKMNSNSLDESNLQKNKRMLLYLIKLYQEHGRNTGNCPVKTKSPGKSKRKALRGMPTNWREMMWDRCSNYDYKGALAVLHLTGARPSEIERGVTVIGDENSEFLEFVIKGSKVGKAKQNGQPERRIFINMRGLVYDGSPVDYLLSCVADSGRVVIRAKAKRLNDYVRRLSQKIWPRRKNHISPYCYRHQLSADLKGEGCLPPKISMILGHRSTLSKKKYGTSRQARGNTHIEDVQCSHALRELPSSPFGEQLASNDVDFRP
ncbi:site-specific integrase [Desulfoplanes formicivorans]|uniref:Tyr recombinase domain-containing protein n=1 Tax=Desulfoplanes formicivorans TaxID=1592317 RepID=A0A194AEB7_9BACT|nr:site-specific integrase [Desulfoplanes formicivorans]GAU08427.1 hypothetical protein DPF_1136 [Desulfoplanes formicivorans]